MGPGGDPGERVSWFRSREALDPKSTKIKIRGVGPAWRPSTAVQRLQEAKQVPRAGWTWGGAWASPTRAPVLFYLFVFSLSGSGKKEKKKTLSLAVLSWTLPG